MTNTLVRSLAAAALVAGAALALPATAGAATSAPPENADTHASASLIGGTAAPVLGFWIGGGTLALAGGAIAVGTTVRRHRHALDA